jgi:hypothetical protein
MLWITACSCKALIIHSCNIIHIHTIKCVCTFPAPILFVCVTLNGLMFILRAKILTFFYFHLAHSQYDLSLQRVSHSLSSSWSSSGIMDFVMTNSILHSIFMCVCESFHLLCRIFNNICPQYIYLLFKCSLKNKIHPKENARGKGSFTFIF